MGAAAAGAVGGPAAPGGSGALCRLCLSARGDTRPIFSQASAGSRLKERILACVHVQIDEDDGLPAQICKKCIGNVNNWHVFKKICEESQAKLRDWANGDVTADQLEVKIKKEPTSEEEDFVIDASYPGVESIEENARDKLQPEGPPILASLGLAPRNEKSNTDPRADWDRVVAIQALIDRDESVEASDVEENDAVDESDDNSDTDQDLVSVQDDDDNSERSEYKSKDGYVKWSKKPIGDTIPDSLKRKFMSGCNGEAANAQTPIQAWSCLITDSMINTIVYYTNEYIEKKYPAITGDQQENATNIIEIKALFGILYLFGIMRPAFYNTSEMWWADGCGLGVVQMAMSLDRFRFLLKCLRFDQQQDDEELNKDKLQLIRKVLDDFTNNCKESYTFGSCGVVDEKFEPFEGPCPFRKSLKSDTASKNGIKMYMLVESDTFYVSNVEICTNYHKMEEHIKNYAKAETIKRLLAHLKGSGMTIVTTPSVTTFNLANNLKKELGLYCVGGISSKSKEVPLNFHSDNNKTGTALFGFTETMVLVSYIQPKRKACMVVSTRQDHFNTRKMHRIGSIPETVIWYKQRKGAPRVASTLAAAYTTAKRCNRWPLAIFFTLLDIAAINAQVIWLSNRAQGDVVFRRNFIRSLALELMNDHIKANNAAEERPLFELDPLLAVRGGPIKNVVSSDALARRHRRCKLCARTADRKTRAYCLSCSTPVCKEHYKPLCICCALKF